MNLIICEFLSPISFSDFWEFWRLYDVLDRTSLTNYYGIFENNGQGSAKAGAKSMTV